MKHIMFFLALLIVAIIAMKVLFWAVSKVIIIALVVGAVYIGARMLTGRKKADQ